MNEFDDRKRNKSLFAHRVECQNEPNVLFIPAKDENSVRKREHEAKANNKII